MSVYYPIYLNLEGKRCLVVGGGAVAERKVLTLLEFAAEVEVISPRVGGAIKELAEKGVITLRERPYRGGDLAGFFLVIGATDERAVNEAVYEEGQARNQLVNIVDVPEYCNFIVPSMVRRRDLNISISTAGKSPALAKKIRRALEERFGGEYGDFLELMGRWRGEIIARVPEIKARKALFQRLVDSDILELLAQRKTAAALERAREICGFDLGDEG